jgi:hypothetical protein
VPHALCDARGPGKLQTDAYYADQAQADAS